MGDLVELEDARNGAREEGAVVRDDHRAAGAVGDEPLQPGQAVEVEVVRRLVEQQDVEAGEQDRGQRRARGLAAGERHGLQVEQGGVQPEVAQDRLGARLEVGAAEREPGLERLGVAVLGARRVRREVVRGRLHARAGLGDAGAPREVVVQPLAGRAVGLLRQVAGRPGRQPHGAAVGPVQAGEQAQQRRLPRAVGPDDPEHLAGRDGDGDAAEDRGGPVCLVQIPRDQGADHAIQRTMPRARGPDVSGRRGSAGSGRVRRCRRPDGG